MPLLLGASMPIWVPSTKYSLLGVAVNPVQGFRDPANAAAATISSIDSFEATSRIGALAGVARAPVPPSRPRPRARGCHAARTRRTPPSDHAAHGAAARAEARSAVRRAARV